jgi:hypothetical protein
LVEVRLRKGLSKAESLLYLDFVKNVLAEERMGTAGRHFGNFLVGYHPESAQIRISKFPTRAQVQRRMSRQNR